MFKSRDQLSKKGSSIWWFHLLSMLLNSAVCPSPKSSLMSYQSIPIIVFVLVKPPCSALDLQPPPVLQAPPSSSSVPWSPKIKRNSSSLSHQISDQTVCFKSCLEYQHGSDSIGHCILLARRLLLHPSHQDRSYHFSMVATMGSSTNPPCCADHTLVKPFDAQKPT